MRETEFTIVGCEPGEYASLNQSTIFMEGDPVESDDGRRAGIGYDDIGGCRRQLVLV